MVSVSRRPARVAIAGAIALALVLLAGLSAWLSAGPAQAATAIDPVSSTTSQAAVVVSGTGTVDLVPDIARLVVSVQATAWTASQAESQNASTTDGVRTRVLAVGIAAGDIKTWACRSGRSMTTAAAPMS